MSLIMSLIHFGLFTDRYERLEQQYGNQPGIQMSCNTKPGSLPKKRCFCRFGEKNFIEVYETVRNCCTKVYEVLYEARNEGLA